MTAKELAEIEARNKQARAYMDSAITAGVKPYIVGNDVGVVLDIVDALLAEVRRLTPAAKAARWGDGGVLNYRYTVLRANNNRAIAKYGYDEHLGRDPWLAWIGANPTRFPTEPEARAHIETWAASKGYEVRDAE